MFELFGKLLKIMTNLSTFIATVHIAVQTAEQSDASGTQKRDAVVKAVITSMKTDFGIDLTGFEPAIQTVVNLIVGVLNNLGIFKHSTSTKEVK